MSFIKIWAILSFSVALAACSGAPSDSDVQAVANQSVQQLEQHLAPLGVSWSDVFDTTVVIKNKAKQNDGRWLVEVETIITAKKDMKDLPEAAQITLLGIAGRAKKGDVLGGGPIANSFHMLKGDKGWLAQ